MLWTLLHSCGDCSATMVLFGFSWGCPSCECLLPPWSCWLPALLTLLTSETCPHIRPAPCRRRGLFPWFIQIHLDGAPVRDVSLSFCGRYAVANACGAGAIVPFSPVNWRFPVFSVIVVTWQSFSPVCCSFRISGCGDFAADLRLQGTGVQYSLRFITSMSPPSHLPVLLCLKFQWKYFWNVPDDVFSQLANRCGLSCFLIAAVIASFSSFFCCRVSCEHVCAEHSSHKCKPQIFCPFLEPLPLQAISLSPDPHLPLPLLLLCNRYDFLIVLFTVALYTVTRFSGHTPFYGFAPVGAPDRAVLAVPLFRVFTAVPSLRRLVLGLVFAVPLYAPPRCCGGCCLGPLPCVTSGALC